MNGIAEYIDYFKEIARIHPDLAADNFTALSIENLMGSYRNKNTANGYSLHAIRYTQSGQEDTNTDKSLVRVGGFIVLGTAKPNDSTARLAVEAKCELISLQVMAKIVEESRSGLPPFYYGITQANFDMQPYEYKAAPDSFGYITFFNFIVPNTVCKSDVNWLPAQ